MTTLKYLFIMFIFSIIIPKIFEQKLQKQLLSFLKKRLHFITRKQWPK
jgi:hypothetical protein